MIRTANAQGLLDSGTRQSLIFAGAMGVLVLVLLFLLSVYGAVTALPLPVFTTLAVVDIVGGGFIVGGIILTGLRHSRGQVNRVVNAMLKPVPVEISVNQITPLALPALPALPTPPIEETPIRYTHFSRGGEVQQIARRTLHGFEPQDVEWLCVYLANGGKWTEAAMEKLPLPYSKEMMGKASEGTKYTAFMELCVRAEIIVGREAKKSGTLAVFDAGEMLKRIKALPEQDA